MKSCLKITLLTVFTLFFTNSSWAAGNVEYVEGEVGLVSASGETHGLHMGDRVEAGDTLITGKNGVINIVTDDNGYIALRPSTRLMIVTYRAEARDDDAIAIRLLRGSFRSITGWVAKKNPSKYEVNTASATIGTRGGIDHEPFVIALDGESKQQPGTYDHVIDGKATLKNAFGEIEITTGKAGFASKDLTPPQMLTKKPNFYKPTANEVKIEEAKKHLSLSSEKSYQNKLRLNESSAVDAAGSPRIIDTEACAKVVDSFRELLSAYENGNISILQRRLSSSMIGYQSFIDQVNTYTNQHKQIQTRLSDVRSTCGPDVGVVEFYWERRSLLMPSFTPQLETGYSSILLHRARTEWELAAVSGDNPFYTRATGKLATVTVSVASIPCNTIGLAGSNPATNFTVTIVDSDKAGATSIAANAVAGADVTSITLFPSTPGSSTFVSANVPVNNSSLSTSPSAVDILPIGGSPPFTCTPNVITVRYVDTTTPSGGAQTVNASISVP
jgi:FecR protein